MRRNKMADNGSLVFVKAPYRKRPTRYQPHWIAMLIEHNVGGRVTGYKFLRTMDQRQAGWWTPFSYAAGVFLKNELKKKWKEGISKKEIILYKVD